jgi:hypothetical protein
MFGTINVGDDVKGGFDRLFTSSSRAPRAARRILRARLLREVTHVRVSHFIVVTYNPATKRKKMIEDAIGPGRDGHF